MILNRKILKKLIVETLQEAEIPEPDPRGEDTGTAYDDVSNRMKSEPQPEEAGSHLGLMEIADYFHHVADQIRQRIDYLDSMPRIEVPKMSEEDANEGIEEMMAAKKDLDEVSKQLEALLGSLKK